VRDTYDEDNDTDDSDSEEEKDTLSTMMQMLQGLMAAKNPEAKASNKKLTDGLKFFVE